METQNFNNHKNIEGTHKFGANSTPDTGKKELTREEYELGCNNYFAAIDDGRDDDETVWRVHRLQHNDNKDYSDDDYEGYDDDDHLEMTYDNDDFDMEEYMNNLEEFVY